MINVASAEDTVLAKLQEYGDTGVASNRQRNDVLGVLKFQGAAPDRAYLDYRAWAKKSEPGAVRPKPGWQY